MSIFGTVAEGAFRYFVCPKDVFITNSLERIDRDGFIYRILKSEGYEIVLFVEKDALAYKVFAYDTFSEYAFKNTTEALNLTRNSAQGTNAFFEKVKKGEGNNATGPNFNTKHGSNTFANLLVKKVPVSQNEDGAGKNVEDGKFGKRELIKFTDPIQFNAMLANQLIPHIKNAKTKTAVIFQNDVISQIVDGRAEKYIDEVRNLNDPKNRNIIIYLSEERSQVTKRQINYLDPQINNNCDDENLSKVIDNLVSRGIIVIADSIGVDEIANCILRKKLIEKDRRFDGIPFSKIYSLAEILAVDLIIGDGENKTFKSILASTNHLAYLERWLEMRENIKAVEEKCMDLCSREMNLAQNNNVLNLERITHIKNDYSIVSDSERMKEFNDAMKSLNSLIGLANVKDKINTIMNSQRFSVMEVTAGHYAFVGKPGTGKTEVARLMGHLMHAAGVLSKGHVVEVKSADIVAEHIGGSAPLTRKKCEEAKGGVFFLDEAYSLINTDGNGEGKFASKFAEESYTEILTFMDNNRSDVCFVFAGYVDKMEKFISANPGMASRIRDKNIIHFPDYTDEELVEILKYMMAKQNLSATPDFMEKIPKYISKEKENTKDFGNARGIRNILTSLDENKNNRLATMLSQGINITDRDRYTLTVEDLDEDISQVDRGAFEKAMAPLNELIGLQSVKNRVVSISNHVENQVARETENRVVPGHYVFSGNPGTGKTEVAKLMGEIFKALGVLKKGHVVSVKASDMIGKFQGDVEEKTQKLCEEAIEGVFFLDEAYSLVNCSEGATGYADENCRKIYDKIMTFMEENKDRVSFIFAGYKDEMRKFISANPGMASRIGENIIDFPDYSVDELYKIFLMMSQKEKYVLADGVEAVLLDVLKEKKKNGGSKFGNARMVRELLVKTTHNQSDRIAKQLKEGDVVTVEDRNTLMPIDITGEMSDVGENAFEQAMKELNNMIGLDAVKHKIKSLFNKEKFSLEGDSSIKTPGHYIFAGNPGTGKTEVAKLMGKIFRSIGLLKTDNLIRVAPADLIGRYSGDTENITKQKCLDALGGILFVDEAYQLAGQGTLANGDSTYGTKALETIMDFMTEHKTNLCVIFAGYEQDMEKIFATNPGFKSRIRETIVFPDYSTPELVEIFKLKINKKLVFGEGFLEKLEVYFDWQKSLAPNDFGNGRAVEQAVEKIMEYRGNRLEELSEEREPSETDIFTLMPEDIPDIKGNIPQKESESTNKVSQKISMQDIVSLLQPYELKPYSKQEISFVIDKSILFVKTDIGFGTAFLISPDGYAVTCNHVIEGATQISARLRIQGRIGGTDSWHKCTVVNSHRDIDIAVIKLEGSNFPYLNIAKSERRIHKGEEFALAGYPFGQMTASDLTTFFGEISSSENQRDEYGLVRYNINSQAKCGNSGAPIVSLGDGSVIGILIGSITNQSGDLTEEINYMRPITYLWEEFME